jgi:hypothetical protein
MAASFSFMSPGVEDYQVALATYHLAADCARHRGQATASHGLTRCRQRPSERRGCGHSPLGSTKTARQRMATRRRARP